MATSPLASHKPKVGLNSYTTPGGGSWRNGCITLAFLHVPRAGENSELAASP